ncbi:MAG: hypothetical protein PHV74_15010 [Dehalococcoidia bacterium]|nr:hypothetical protein [Dehalococcoidia bacterium]
MKARIAAVVFCPECGFHMWRDSDHVRCANEDCKLCDKKFEYPTVELKEKKE